MFSESSRLQIKDLIINGVHGSTGREPTDKQRFKITLNIDVDADQAAKTDSIADAFDYKVAQAIARHVVEGESHVLLEKIAYRIVSRICQYRHVKSAEVTIEKLDASQRCIPAFTGSMKRAPQEQHSGLIRFDAAKVVAQLKEKNGCSFPVLSESYRQALLEEAEMYDSSEEGYAKQDEIVGPAKVREQLWVVKKLFSGSLFHRLRDEFQGVFRTQLRDAPFNTPLNLNELVLQRYDAGSMGITPHRDFIQNVNLIAIFVLAGKARFALCDDRKGTNLVDLDTTPGNVILMRAPGFLGSDFRPFHTIFDVQERRVVCAIRELKEKAPR